ncbi:hypothetical protein [Nostoc sp.]|uniref:hypothetical protein n=1 Tax=Nostoc sp. TaxID=1180 RepID=UPI002FF566E4
MLWASQQKPSVTQLWQECWTADPYGSRWMPQNLRRPIAGLERTNQIILVLLNRQTRTT